MRKIALAFFLLLNLTFCYTSNGQNFSNRGSEFWTCFPVHVDQTAAGIQLFLTADKQTFVTVEIPGASPNSYVGSAGTLVPFAIFTINPNQVCTVTIANSVAYMGNVAGVINNKAIRVKTLQPTFPPFVCYSHIYSSAQSDASLVLPVNTLGREYYTQNYPQRLHGINLGGTNPGPHRSFIAIIATDPGVTNVEVTLPPGYPLNGVSINSGNTGPASSTFSFSLNQGQMFQLLSATTTNATLALDLTGTRVITTSNTGECKKIAVYSGSSRVEIRGPTCNPSTTSGDNLYEIMYPTAALWKNYIIPPIIGRPSGNGSNTVVRVVGLKNNTSVSFNNGTPQVINAGQVITRFETTVLNIAASEPISVAQFYTSTLGCQTGSNLGDPSMVIWSPLEQTLNKITLFASYRDAISATGSYVQVITKTIDTSRFRLDNQKIPFTVVPANPAYSFANRQVTTASTSNLNQGIHNLTSDSGFIAVSYGWGNYESYGYSSGANIKNLNQFITASVDSGCVGSSLQFTGTAIYTPTSWKWYFGDNTTANTQNAAKTYSAPGKYTVSLVTTIPGGSDCDSKDSTTIDFIVNAKPSTNFAWTGKCENDTIKFSDSSNTSTSFITKWRWSFGDGDTSSLRNPKKKYAGPGTYQVKLWVENNGMCSDSIIKSVVIYPKPSVNFSTTSNCQKDTFSFTNQTTIASGGTLVGFLWRWGTGDSVLTFNVNDKPKYLFSSKGTYQVQLIAATSNACVDSITKTVSIDPNPVAKFGVQSVCEGDSSTFTDSSFVNTPSTINKWQWRFGDLGTDTLQNPKHLYTSITVSGIYQVFLKVTTDKGCTDSVITPATVHHFPVAKFDERENCLRDTTSFIDSSYLVTGTITNWHWSLGDGNTFTTQNKKHVYSNPGQYNVRLVVSTSFNCKDTVTKTIKIFPKPVASFTVAMACQNDSAFFVNTSTILSGNKNYFWDFGDTSGTSTNTNPAYLYKGPGFYVARLRVVSDSGCVDSTFKSVQVYPRPKSAFSVQSCPSDSIQFTDLSDPNGDAIVSQLWDFGDGKTSNIKNPKHLYTAEGSFGVRLIVNTAYCSDTLLKNITVSFKPKANFTTTDVCVYESASFNDNSSIYVSSVVDWQWNFGDGNTSTLQNPTHLYSSPNTYNVQLIATALTGCKDTIIKQVVIHPKPSASFDLLSPCYTDSAVFADKSGVTSGSITNHLWDFADGTFDSRKDPKHMYGVAGNYSVSLRVISDKNCRDSVTKQIQINLAPDPKIIANDTCVNDTVYFDDQSTTTDGVITKWGWTFDLNGTDTVKSPKVVFTQPGTYTVKLSLTTSSGCSYNDIGQKTITIHPRPEVNFKPTPDSSTILMTQIKFENATKFADKYEWSFGDSSAFSSLFDPIHDYEDTGTYRIRLIASTNFGCKDSAFGRVVIWPEFTFYIPTAFSPNVDGLNDGFAPVGEGWKTYELVIYNRWGEEIFAGKPNEAWLGMYNNKLGSECPDAVYVWTCRVIDLKNKKKYFNGIVTLVR
jgi:PKD repeat protein